MGESVPVWLKEKKGLKPLKWKTDKNERKHWYKIHWKDLMTEQIQTSDAQAYFYFFLELIIV